MNQTKSTVPYAPNLHPDKLHRIPDEIPVIREYGPKIEKPTPEDFARVEERLRQRGFKL